MSRADVLGCPVDRLTADETLAAIEEVVETGGFAQHVCVNAAKLVALRRDRRLREIVEGCELVSADGMAIVWASRLLGDPLPERVNGTDLMLRLLGVAERRGWSVYVLGAKPDVLERALARIRAAHPGLRIAGARDGYFADEESAAVAEAVREAAPDLLFVAMSSPGKEVWLAGHGRGLGVPLVMGVGGSIDIVAGVTRRAPRWMQAAGLEWLFRLAQEPRRLGRRYLVTNAQFLGLLGRELLRRRTT
jgi:N-acetylglucosaminyldiphosphoundecaprenol N-acetyl-beta-D-mannosaminyltransferase